MARAMQLRRTSSEDEDNDRSSPARGRPDRGIRQWPRACFVSEAPVRRTHSSDQTAGVETLQTVEARDTILASRIRLPSNEPWREDFVAESVAFPYSDVFKRRLRAMGIRDKPTAPRSPRQNGHCERLIGSIRRECLDHVVVLGERHPRHVLLSYLGYYNRARTHLALCKDAPISRATQSVETIRSTPILGGLHHQYGRI